MGTFKRETHERIDELIGRRFNDNFETPHPRKLEWVILANSLKLQKSPFAILLVMSLPESQNKRTWIRNTWYKWKDQYNVQVVFFMGKRKRGDFNYNKQVLEMESETYQDIVVDDFEEEYYGLAIKVLRGMKFYLENFRNKNSSSGTLPFFVKVDDDIFLNLPNLVNDIKSKSSSFRLRKKSGGFTAGHVHQMAKPNYNPFSKYYIPYDVWEGYWFPAYAGGPCYIISGNLIQPIFYRSLERGFFPFEDVFISGIVGNYELGISPVKVHGIRLFFPHETLTDEEFDRVVKRSVAIAPLHFSEAFLNKAFQRTVALISADQG